MILCFPLRSRAPMLLGSLFWSWQIPVSGLESGEFKLRLSKDGIHLVEWLE